MGCDVCGERPFSWLGSAHTCKDAADLSIHSVVFQDTEYRLGHWGDDDD